MIDCYGYHTRELCLPEPEERYEDRPEIYEPFVSNCHLPTMPDTPEARAWKQRLADACKKEVK
jgi:hypothetical protein